MVRLQIRRRRFLILAQGWSASDNPGYPFQNTFYTLKGLDGWRTLTGFQFIVGLTPRVLAALEPWAKISERLRRISNCTPTLQNCVTTFKLHHYPMRLFYQPESQQRCLGAGGDKITEAGGYWSIRIRRIADVTTAADRDPFLHASWYLGRIPRIDGSF